MFVPIGLTNLSASDGAGPRLAVLLNLFWATTVASIALYNHVSYANEDQLQLAREQQ